MLMSVCRVRTGQRLLRRTVPSLTWIKDVRRAIPAWVRLPRIVSESRPRCAMLGFGINRTASGFIADRIGGLATLLAGALLQTAALALYLAFEDLTSLYVISALFGLFQGSIVPAYAIIVREYLPAEEAGARIGADGNAVRPSARRLAHGGIFDSTKSYHAAFVNGLTWNGVNLAIALWLIHCRRPCTGLAAI